MVIRRILLATMALAVGGTIAVACTLFDSSLPDKSCKLDKDCFTAQGEHCTQTTHVCTTIDAGSP